MKNLLLKFRNYLQQMKPKMNAKVKSQLVKDMCNTYNRIHKKFLQINKKASKMRTLKRWSDTPTNQEMQIKRKMRDPAILLLVICPKAYKFHQHSLEMFIETLFIKTETGNHPNVRNTRKDSKTVVYIHTTDYYTTMRMNNL